MKNQKVLVVRFSSIGDIVLTTPIIRTLNLQLGAEIHFITKTKFKSVISHNPYISKIHCIDKEITEIVESLKRQEFDYVIDLHNNLRSKRLIFALGVKSYTYDKLNVKKWLKVNFKIDYLPNKHIVDRYFEGVSLLGVKNDGKGLDYFISNSDKEKSANITKHLNSYDVLVLGANYFTKRIPFELSCRIINNNNLPLILLGGNDVKSEAEKLIDKYPKKVYNFVGKTTLSVSAGIISMASKVHTSDTGLMHIAAAYKREIITYWGSTTPKFGMYPYLPKNSIKSANKQVSLKCRPCSKIGYDSCPKGHFKCMHEQIV